MSPNEIINEAQRTCSCCPECWDHPCASAISEGICGQATCVCVSAKKASICICIGCMRDDFKACIEPEENIPCSWLRVDRADSRGVCSKCPDHAARWDNGDRALAVLSGPSGSAADMPMIELADVIKQHGGYSHADQA